jgi:hypothetical protein
VAVSIWQGRSRIEGECGQLRQILLRVLKRCDKINSTGSENIFEPFKIEKIGRNERIISKQRMELSFLNKLRLAKYKAK